MTPSISRMQVETTRVVMADKHPGHPGTGGNMRKKRGFARVSTDLAETKVVISRARSPSDPPAAIQRDPVAIRIAKSKPCKDVKKITAAKAPSRIGTSLEGAAGRGKSGVTPAAIMRS